MYMGVSSHDRQFGQSAYLTLAHRAISRSQRPLTPREMLQIAFNEGFLPSHLFGKTMYKTLSARLSEHIRIQNNASIFFRTAPSTFYLHSLTSRSDTPDEFKRVFIGNLRSKSIRKENVLVAPKDELNSAVYGEFTPFENIDFESFYQSHCKFIDRSKVENDDKYKQFVTFTIVISDMNILVYRRGKFTTTSNTLKGQMSVGFGGHVNDTDFDLFDRGGDAFKSNAARELREELFLDNIYKDRNETISRTKILGYINVDDNFDASHHIAILVAFYHKENSLPKKGELSINQLAWHNFMSRQNDFSDFDLWSEIILRNIRSGQISVI
jgi:predicted NUDIX family phosphoesterase